MPPTLPASLSPHICIVSSPDVEVALRSGALPSLPQILQSFSPVSSVTARTSTLIQHPQFALRFSDLAEIEEACREDEEERANRTIDWISSRVSEKAAKWVEIMNRTRSEGVTTPWWEELKKCAEGNVVPSRTEGWNHPVAIIFAVSTIAANPLQALQDLHARQIDLPPWVDPTYLRCTLIIQCGTSSLSDPITESLFNAVKKQYNNSHLLKLTLPSPPPSGVPSPALLPQLPNNSEVSGPDAPQPQTQTESFTIKMIETDLASTAKFVRELAVESLIPWMGKWVLEWNEAYSSSRRLPSRLFSSTRRLFGTGSISNSPAQGSVSLPSHGHTGSTSSVASLPGNTTPLAQQRRLAEFATILGDYKLAIPIWEVVRKEGKGGSEILPLLLTASPAVGLHAKHAIGSISTSYPASMLVTALVYTVRWDVGITKQDFLSRELEGERWLVWAAGSAEEAPAALLLAHAAQLSVIKGARRRAALWFLFAANRLEKCGIKPLTTYFLRRAQMMYESPIEKELSPSFWESEDKSPKDWKGFEGIVPGIEHALGRLLYTTGDVEAAVKLFLGLLKGVSSASPSLSLPGPFVGPNGAVVALPTQEAQVNLDKIFLEDFRVAFSHWVDTAGAKVDLASFRLPITFCKPKLTKLRLRDDQSGDDKGEWEEREREWTGFWRARGGKEKLDNRRRGVVNEAIWADFVLKNPLQVDVELTDLTVVVKEAGKTQVSKPQEGLVEVEEIDRISLAPGEQRTIPISIRSLRPTRLVLTELTYKFFASIPCSEPLGTRGRRLNDTIVQRQNMTYAPDVFIEVETEECRQRLDTSFVEDKQVALIQGERKRLELWINNTGVEDVNEVWMVSGPENVVWVEKSAAEKPTGSSEEVFQSPNSVSNPTPSPIRIEDYTGLGVLKPEGYFRLPIVYHADRVEDSNICLMFVYRLDDGGFRSARASLSVQVQPAFEISISSKPGRGGDTEFSLSLEVENTTPSTSLKISQISTMSPSWTCHCPTDGFIVDLPPSQIVCVGLGVRRWENGAEGIEDTRQFVRRKIGVVLRGEEIDPSEPPPLEVSCSHFSGPDPTLTFDSEDISYLVRQNKRKLVRQSLSRTYPSIPSASHQTVFPLYNPASLDMLVFWEVPSQKRAGHILVSGLTLGAEHGDLRGIIEEAESAKVKRSMYAETQKEKMEVMQAVKGGEWNVNSNPVVVSVKYELVVEHDFESGSCSVPVTFVISNCSLTHPAKFVFRLPSSESKKGSSSHILSPQYTGRRTFRGLVERSQTRELHAKMWIYRPGTYSLDGWVVESEVGDRQEDGTWKTRHRYSSQLGQQHQVNSGISCVTVRSVSKSA
ncbi:hypothetical protein BDM02DRAFT_3185724 [Thelephora ganbajun]|uniref:Uncharacterized protein n=1 Tax=Thelephora ganbajun TaxID=370292 RepID=A0ACB6ZKI8_THEGA|nr:hypothetical protein BDM02DRAFT_3185724 [Thelephora ganbajun]